jgi:5-formyltetrahydrofolate cyclo-ligase
MFYIALEGEVETRDMIETAKRLGKTISVPVVRQRPLPAAGKPEMTASQKNRISIRPCILDDNAALKKGPYGVSEPAQERFVAVRDLDLVIVPGIAFAKNGERLGRGKGCYDRFLKRLPADTPSIGLAFGFQVLPQLPTTLRDVKVKKVLSA